jgi:hypothetical protein
VIEVIAFQNQTVVYDILFRAASERYALSPPIQSIWAQRSALVHFQREGQIAPTPGCYAVTGWRRRTESGRPATNIRFSTAPPMAASVCWAARPRARSRGPISVL